MNARIIRQTIIMSYMHQPRCQRPCIHSSGLLRFILSLLEKKIKDK